MELKLHVHCDRTFHGSKITITDRETNEVIFLGCYDRDFTEEELRYVLEQVQSELSK